MPPLETLAPVAGYALLGLLELLFGYRLFRWLVVVLGVLAGFAFGPTLYAALIGESPELIASAFAALVAALIFGVLANVALVVAAALWVALFAFTVAGAFLDMLFLQLLVALAAGLLALFLERPAVIAITSLHGAWLMVAAVAALLGVEHTLSPLPLPLTPLLLSDTPFLLGAALLLALAGILIQAGSPPRRARSRRR